MHAARIPIWFFIGVLLVIYGAMICGYGLVELSTGSYPPGVQLTNLLLGLFYVLKFRPGKARR
jgi:hypothetical protein